MKKIDNGAKVWVKATVVGKGFLHNFTSKTRYCYRVQVPGNAVVSLAWEDEVKRRRTKPKAKV